MYHNNLPLLPYTSPCVIGHFLQRHRRFSVAVIVDGEQVWIHSNNSGSMLGLLRPGMPVLMSRAPNSQRKLPYTQEAVWVATTPDSRKGDMPDDGATGFWVGVNTLTPNRMLEAAFAAQRLPFATGYTHLQREAKRGDSRLDGLLTAADKPPLWVECKNVTLVEDNIACFPDACTERGQKHLRAMMDIVRNGERAVMFYLVQRADGMCFAPAGVVDTAYANLFWQAVDAGVEICAMRANVSCTGIDLAEVLPLAPRGCI